MKARLIKTYRLLLILALIPALLILSLRLGLPQVSRFSDDISTYLSDTLGMQIEWDALDASLDQWRVTVQVTNLGLFSQSEMAPQLSLKAARLDLTLDLLRSLQARLPVFSVVAMEEADLLMQEYQGQWLSSPSDSADSSNQQAKTHYLLEWLQHQPSIILHNLNLGFQPEDGEMQFISPVNAMLENAADESQISGSFRIPRLGEDAYAVFALHALTFDPEDLLSGHYRFFLQSDALGPELLNMGFLPVGIDALDLSTHVWGEWQDHQLSQLQGDLTMRSLMLSDDRWPAVDQLEMQFAFLPLDEQRYQLQLGDITAVSGDKRLDIAELVTNFRIGPDVMPVIELLSVSSLDLASLHYWIEALDIFPEEIDAVLQRLSPQGRVSDLVMHWQDPSDWLGFALQARIQDVAVSAWEDAPEASGITGIIHAGATEGKVILESAEFTLNFPSLFGSGWHYSEASGEVSWQVTGEALRLNSHLLSLSNDDIHAKGRFGLYRPFDSEEQIEFSLLIGITDTDALQTEFYTPPRELGETLYDWLKTSIRAGHVNQAGLMIHAGLRPGAYHLPVSVQLFLDADDAEFAFDEEWPSVEQGRLFLQLRNTELRIDIASGQILNSEIDSGWIYLPPNSQELNVAAMLQGDASDFSVLLQESALGDYLGSGFNDWQLAGDTRTRLALQVPVGRPDALGVQVSSQLQNNRLLLQERDLQFTDISGQIIYSSRDGLRSDALQGDLFNQPLNAQITSQGSRTQVLVKGLVSSEHVDQLTGLHWGSRLHGASHVDMNLTLCSESAICPRLELSSDLVGTAIDLPLGLGKTETEQRLFSLDLYPDQQRAHFSYDQLLQGVVDLSTLVRGQFILGEGNPVLPQGNQLAISGELPQLSVQGQISRGALQHWNADFEHLHWRPLTEQAPVPLLNGLDTPVTMDMSHFPDLTLSIDDLQTNGRPLGAWSLEMLSRDNDIYFESILGRLADFVVEGDGFWRNQDDASSGLNLNVQGNDLASILQQWDQGRPIETEVFSASAELRWQGNPWQFSLETLDGHFAFQADNGRIIESGAGANLLRVFGLLNLNTLSRRLRLDFSDLLQRGLVFDQLKADYSLDKGIAQTQEPLVMTGPSAGMEIDGQVNLNTHQLDKTIRVSVPLGSNLTLGAVLLGAPQVAGALFIFDRIMGDRIEKMTRIAYTLTGDWADPQLNLLNPAD